MACEGLTYEMMKQMSDMEKNRILAIVANSKVSDIKWDQVALDLGAASVNSAQTQMYTMRKKYGAARTGPVSPDKATKPSTPRKSKGSPRKRKGDNSEGATEEPPSPSKAARKKQPTPKETPIKGEQNDDPTE